MVKRTITITTILLILTMVVGLIIVLNKSSYATEDIASGVNGTCSWIIDSNGILSISPIEGDRGDLSYTGVSYLDDDLDLEWAPWYSYRNNITKVVVNSTINTPGKTCGGLFYNLKNCTEMDLSGLNTAESIRMDGMFRGCESIQSIDISTFDLSRVTLTGGMFEDCKALTSITFGNINTSNVENMNFMFSGCESLTSLDVSSFNTSSVTSLKGAFAKCKNIQTINFTGWDVSHVTTMELMFSECEKLVILNLSSWNTSSLRTARLIFDYCTSLEWLDISGFDTNQCNNLYMFTGDYALRTVILGERFNPKGNGETSIYSSQAFMLPYYQEHGYTGRWIRKDRTYGPFNYTEFLNNYLPTMAGEWVLEISPCAVLADDGTFSFVRTNEEYEPNTLGTIHSISDNDYTGQIFTVNEGTGTSIGLRTWDSIRLQIKRVVIVDELKPLNLNSWFDGCEQCTEMDLLNLDASRARDIMGMFNGCDSLELVKLGENHRFVGLTSPYKSTLPTPNGPYCTGKWIREDKVYGPFTPEELRENYSAEMAGTWISEKIYPDYTIRYSYNGFIPTGASELPTDETYHQGEEVIVAPNATAPGYTFSGWSRTGTFEMPAENVEITGSFIQNTDTPYKVEHYLEDLVEGTYTLAKTDNLTGTTDTEAHATAKDYEGFTFDNSIAGTNLSGNIAGNGSLVLKIYYKRNSYNVTYAYTGDVPNDATALPQTQNYKYGAEIIVPVDATAEGYTFSGWIKNYITMPAQDIEITGYFIENPKSYSYKIEYYFDGKLDESVEEILNGEENTDISISPQSPIKHDEKNYTLVSDDHKVTISTNEDENIIRVYYETDVLDYEIDNLNDTTEGDGLPDKYQIQIHYKVENGSWDDGTNGTKTQIATLRDTNGELSEQGTGKLTAPQVGNKPAEGYIKGSWNKDIPSKASKVNDGEEFIYSYKNNEIAKASVSEKSGKASNPKTTDVMPIFLLVGTIGILALIVAKKNRKKYSRKAKNIQY